MSQNVANPQYHECYAQSFMHTDVPSSVANMYKNLIHIGYLHISCSYP